AASRSLAMRGGSLADAAEALLGPERERHDALVLGGVDAARTRAEDAKRGGEGPVEFDLLPRERRPEHRILHFRRKPQSAALIPAGMEADHLHVEARIANSVARDAAGEAADTEREV